MKEIICELGAFSVIGQEVELTNLQKRNIQITTQFWREFNENLKKAYLSQMGGEYRPIQSNFLHFEKYDRRFHWNKESSVIEICVAIEH